MSPHGRLRAPSLAALSLALLVVLPAAFAPAVARATSDTFTINASAGSHGSISPSGAVVVNAAASQSFTITPDPGYHVADVEVDGSSVGSPTSYEFDDVTSDHTISATFAINTWTVTASAGANGGITPSGVTTVNDGDSLAFTITPDTGYHVADVQVDGSSVGAVTSYTLTNIEANHTIAASFAIDTYTITASAGANGSIAPNGVTTVNYGDSPAYTITPATGYQVADVQVDGSSVGAVTSYTFTNVQANHTIAASFALVPAVISAASPAGTLSSTTTSLSVPVNVSRTYSISNRLFHVTFQLSGGLALTGGTAGITEGTWLKSGGDATTFQVIDNGGGSYTADGTILGSPCDNTALTGNLFNVAVSSGSPGGTGALTITGVELRDCDNASLASSIGTAASVAIDNAPPTVTVTSPNGGEFWAIGSSHAITWTASDNVGVSGVDLAYSSDGGATFPHVIATGLANSGSYSWTIPSDATPQALVRATAHDAAGNAASDTSDANFTIGQWTITASAGANGSIAPSGSIGVDNGGSQAFTITPAAGYYVADVLVDGSSVGAVTSYTFSNVTANHTIAASFTVTTYVITASAGANGSISPSGADTVAYGSSPAFTITPATGYHVADVLVDSASVGAVTSYTFNNVTANHAIAASFAINTYTITASAGPNGSITPNGTIEANYGDSLAFTITADAHFHVDSVVVDGSNAGAVTAYSFAHIAANHTIAAAFTANPPVSAITALSAVQVKSGNDSSGTTKIAVSWPALGGGQTVQVYRAPFGNYPLYDNPPNPGSAPVAPAYPPTAPWVLTPVTTSGATDSPGSRDDWYYVAFVTDQYGTRSPVSNVAGGVLDYFLGDVTDGMNPGQGNNQVDLADISLLGAHYGLSGAEELPYAYLDVGPTTSYSVDGRPITDGQIDFEDLVMFAIDYMQVSAPASAARPLVAAATDGLLLDVPSSFSEAGTMTARLQMTGTGTVHGLSARLSWDPAVVKPVSYAPGVLLDEQNGIALSAHPGVVDLARLGVANGLVGSGEVANVTFQRIGSGDPKIALASVDARDASNHKLSLAFRSVQVPSAPTVTSFERIAPNPFRSTTNLSFGLARGGAVELSIYSVDGRRVKQLVHAVRDAGTYVEAWDGRGDDGGTVAAGIYYARLETPQGHFTRSMVFLK